MSRGSDNYYPMFSPILLKRNISSPGLKHRFIGCMYSPSLRHEHLPREVPQSLNESFRLMRLPRLLPGGRNRFIRLGLLIRFTPFQDRISCFRQVPGYSDDGLGMALALHDSPVEMGHVTARLAALMNRDHVGRLNQSPSQISVHIRPDFSKENPPSARLDAGDSSGIAG